MLDNFICNSKFRLPFYTNGCALMQNKLFYELFVALENCHLSFSGNRFDIKSKDAS